MFIRSEKRIRDIEEIISICKCDICGQEFQSRWGAQSCCSNDCYKVLSEKRKEAAIKRSTQTRKERRNAARAQLPDSICSHCQQSFRPLRNNAQYCSDKCRQAAYRERKKVTQKEEVKKPYVLNLFIYPQEEWLDEKGDFKGHKGEYPGPMLTCAMMADTVKEISQMQIVKKYVDVRIINYNAEPDLLKKYSISSGSKFPLMFFHEADESGLYIPINGSFKHVDIIQFVNDTLEPLAEAEKLNMSLSEYYDCLHKLEEWKKAKEKARKRKEYRKNKNLK